MLAALTAAPVTVDPARLAHHAEQAGDAVAAVRFARAAAERAAAVGAHRQAAAQYGRALRFSEDAPAAERAELLERRADALYAADDQPGSIADLHAAIDLHRELGDPFREAGATARLVPRLTCCALFDEASAAAERAVELVGSSTRPEAAAAVAARAHVDLVLDRLTSADRARPGGGRGRRAARQPRRGDRGRDRRRDGDLPARRAGRSGASGGRPRTCPRAGARVPPSARAQQPRAVRRLLARPRGGGAVHAGEGLEYTDGHDLDLWRLSILGTTRAVAARPGSLDGGARGGGSDPRPTCEPRRDLAGRRSPSLRPCAPVAAIPRRRGPSPRPRRRTPASRPGRRRSRPPRPRSPGSTAARATSRR